MSTDTADDTQSDRHDLSTDPQLLSPAAAALQLGLSESTVRRRVKAGLLPGTQVEQGARVILRIPADVMLGSAAKHDSSSASQRLSGDGQVARQIQSDDRQDHLSDMQAALALLEKRDQQLATANEQIMQLSGQVGFLQSQNQEQEKQITLLQAPPEKPRGRWWRRLWPTR